MTGKKEQEVEVYRGEGLPLAAGIKVKGETVTFNNVNGQMAVPAEHVEEFEKLPTIKAGLKDKSITAAKYSKEKADRGESSEAGTSQGKPAGGDTGAPNSPSGGGTNAPAGGGQTTGGTGRSGGQG